MRKLSEEEVYNGTKQLLKKSGYNVIGGQPPRGVDHLPVIEVKSDEQNEKGSKLSYKPDLIAFKDGRFFLIECKPVFDIGDYQKLLDILHSEQRLFCLFNELKQRNILKKLNYNLPFDDFKKNIIGMLSYSGEPKAANGVIHIIIEDFRGVGKFLV